MAGIFALALGYVLSQFYRTFLAVLTPALKTDLGATNADLSIASGAWFAAFALMQFVVGVSLDRSGPRRTSSLLLAFGGAGGAFLFALASSPWMVVAAMTLIGIGCSPVLMSAVYIFARNHSPARLAIMTSWMVAFGSAGNVFGASPMAAAADAFGWREVMAGLGVGTLAVSAAMLVIVRDPARLPQEGPSGFRGYLDLFRLRLIWPLIPIIALNYAPASGIRGLWAGPYLSDVYGADALAIGNATLFMALAMVAGAFVYGPLDTFFRTRKWVVVAGNLIGLGVILSLALAPSPGVFVSTVHFVLIGITGSAYGILMAHGRAFMPAHLTGRGMTMLNFYSIGGVGLAQFATGAVYSATATPSQPAAGYAALFVFYAALIAISLAIYLLARDAKPEAAIAEVGAAAR